MGQLAEASHSHLHTGPGRPGSLFAEDVKLQMQLGGIKLALMNDERSRSKGRERREGSCQAAARLRLPGSVRVQKLYPFRIGVGTA